MASAQEMIQKGCFVNIDKPVGKTSHDIDLIIRKIFGVKKSGHFGTLDPAVTGVLVVAVSKAVKLFQYMKSGKEYVGVMKIHGEKKPSMKKVQEVINEHFTGKIKQTPPVKSAVKRVEREREVYKFKILEKDEDKYLFDVSCEAGTYIRKLCSDLGEKLGSGAHMAELRRTRAGMFDESTIVKLDELVRAVKENDEKALMRYLIPQEVVTKDIKSVSVREDGMKRIGQGGPTFKSDVIGKVSLKKGEKVAVLYDKELIAVVTVINEGKMLGKSDSVLI